MFCDEEKGFLEALGKTPRDTMLRLVFADWLEENSRYAEATAHRFVADFDVKLNKYEVTREVTRHLVEDAYLNKADYYVASILTYSVSEEKTSIQARCILADWLLAKGFKKDGNYHKWVSEAFEHRKGPEVFLKHEVNQMVIRGYALKKAHYILNRSYRAQVVVVSSKKPSEFGLEYMQKDRVYAKRQMGSYYWFIGNRLF